MLSCSSSDDGGSEQHVDPSTAAGAGGGATAGFGGSVSSTAGAGGSAAASGGAAGAAAGAGGTAAGSGGAPPSGTGGSDAGSSGSEAGTGGEGGTGPSGGDGGDTAPPKENCLQGTGDFGEDGPYEVETSTVTIGASGQFTIYVPSPLEEDCPHPIVAWGNGTTVPGGTAYRHFNERMATWGIVVLASHDDGTASSGPRIGDGSFHRAAIDYMLAENEDSSSEFFGKISGRAGVTGHSQGGAGGDRASSHPNVEANGNVQGSFGSAPEGVAFLCLTGTEDIATEGCLNAVESTSSPAMYASYDGMSHVATLSASSAGSRQYARLLTGWFRCFLADDSAACELFQGGDACPICQESGWDNIFSANY